MIINKIEFLNFRNLKNISLNLYPKLNFFCGLNGQGKTSIIEALYFSCTGKSFRENYIKNIISFGKDNLVVNSQLISHGLEKNFSVSYSLNGKKTFFMNSKKIQYDDFFKNFGIVYFVPNDMELIDGSPLVRRNYFDFEISQYDYDYYICIKDFYDILKLRNGLLKLKVFDKELFNVYNEKFLDLSSKIIFKRIEYIKSSSIHLNLYYRKLFKNNSEVSINYYPEFYTKKSIQEIRKILYEQIDLCYKKDLYFGFSNFGPHRDDFYFSLNGKNSKFFASQGEKKSIIFCSKISELDLLYKNSGENPVFIIDDIDSYFDIERKESILKFLIKKDIQVFITSVFDFNIKNMLSSDYVRYYNVCEGGVQYV